MSFKLMPGRTPRGHGLHRDGWPAVFKALEAEAEPDGILLDDFIEQTFKPGRPSYWHKEPWVGIFHHPERNTFQPRAAAETILEGWDFRDSLPNLKAAIVLSWDLEKYIYPKVGVPTYVLRYPSPVIADENLWDWHKFRSQPLHLLAQVGWYQRNTQAIYQIPFVHNWTYGRYWPEARWVQGWDDACAANYYRLGTRPRYQVAQQWPLLQNAEYDDMLASSVILTELIEGSANTVLVECIARRTPICINRHPAVVEYLQGPDYPLFYDDIREVPDLLNLDRIKAAHDYLAAFDSDWLSMDRFVNRIKFICQRHQDANYVPRSVQEAGN